MNDDVVLLRIYVPPRRKRVAQVVRLAEHHEVLGSVVWRAAVEIENVPGLPWRLVDGPATSGVPRRDRQAPAVAFQLDASRLGQDSLSGPWPTIADGIRKVVEIERNLSDPWAGWAWVPGRGNTLVPAEDIQHALRSRQRKLVINLRGTLAR